MFYFYFLTILITMFLLLNSFSSWKSKNIFNDLPFECGISSNLSSRKPYSMPFFFFMLIFLLFDMEVILIFPLLFFKFSMKFMILYLVIMIILVSGLLYEWVSGSLKW